MSPGSDAGTNLGAVVLGVTGLALAAAALVIALAVAGSRARGRSGP